VWISFFIRYSIRYICCIAFAFSSGSHRIEKLFRAYELRKRSFATEDYLLNYEIIFVCIHMTLYETLVRFRLPSFKITNSLAQARQFVGFFAKLNSQASNNTTNASTSGKADARATSSSSTTAATININSSATPSPSDHFIYRALREDMQQYGFFFICCFLHVYHPLGALSPQLVDAIECFFLKRSESSDRMEEARLPSGPRKRTAWNSQSETDTSEQSATAQRKLLTMSIPRCDWLSLVEDACVIVDRFREHVHAFSLYFSESQYANVTPLLSGLANSNLQSLELIQMHSLGDFKLTKVRCVYLSDFFVLQCKFYFLM
jgi:hypothetical protein